MLFEPSLDPAVAQPSRRSAALMLHGMSDADRAWAWSRLDDTHRQALTPLLQELQDLGVPRDAALLGDAVAADPVAPSAAPRTARQHVAAADAVQVADALAAEPAGLVRRLLALGPWPWQDAVLAALRTRRADAFEPVDQNIDAPATALDEALLARLADRLSQVSATTRADAPTWWSGLLQAARSRLGGRTR